jgi:LmbE family N-acetylglucosaminyl deacetylase
MIESLIAETGWLASLEALPSWHPQAGRIVVIAPHPDDETLGAGGFIATMARHGANIVVAAVTDGENAYLEAPSAARRLGEIRTAEQTNALAALGVPNHDIHRFHLPDSDVSSHENKLETLLSPLVSEDTLVVAPWTGDFHPDHEACGRAGAHIAKKTGANLASYFFWTWHRGAPELISNLPLKKFPLTPRMQQAKADALAQHRSQLVREAGEPILPEHLLAPARRNFEVFAIS